MGALRKAVSGHMCANGASRNTEASIVGPSMANQEAKGSQKEVTAKKEGGMTTSASVNDRAGMIRV